VKIKSIHIIIVLTLLSAVINGGFYTYAYITNKQSISTAITNAQASESYLASNHPLSIPTQDIILIVPNDNEEEITVPKEIVAEWFEEFERSFTDRKELRIITKDVEAYLASVRPEIDKRPVNARVGFDGEKITIITPPQKGRSLNIELSIDSIYKQLRQGEVAISLVTEIIEPEVSLDEINDISNTALLAKGESNFSGSSESRIHNIKISANKFHGTIIKPGEEFSFNETVGEINARTGYRPELVIKGDKLIPEYGGGVCQVSTTMFRAAIYSGLLITERRSHSLPVRYYDPQGFDATIYLGVQDLKFINNTPGNILIQTKIENNKLYVSFYGKSDERKVKIIGPTQYDREDNGTFKASLTRITTFIDGEKTKDSFYSYYKSPDLFTKEERNPLE